MSDPNGNGPPPAPNFGTKIPLVGLDDAAQAIKSLTSEIVNLKQALGQLGGSGGGAGAQVGNLFKNLTTNANQASGAIKTMFSQMTGTRPAGASVGSLLEYGMQGDFGHDLAMFPLRFMQSTISSNRQLAYNTSTTLSGMQYAQNRPMAGMLGTIGGQMKSGGGRYGLRGTADEVTQTFAAARQYGAMYDFGTPIGGTQGAPRTEGFFRGTAEMANMYPGASLPSLAGAIGGFSANTAAQQRSLFMSGGAFGMVGAGGSQKTVSQWAESILNFLEQQRFGGKQGQGFDYGQLLSQNFPGSNIDAWLDANGVPPDMKEAWWNYALNKAKTKGSTSGGVMAITPQVGNLAYQRSRAVTATARPQLQLAQSLTPAYNSREKSNAGFNSAMGSVINSLIRQSAVTDMIAKVPDTIEEFLMQFLENSGTFGSLVGGGLGYGTMGFNLFSNLFGEGGLIGGMGLRMEDIIGGMNLPTGIDFSGGSLPKVGADIFDIAGDVGDTGWGPTGSRGTSSLHPDVGSKVSAMMAANPRLRINSSRRDEVTQRSLRGKGHSRVSGKSSAHTRGLAADLGPASEYGWISANASKFGLKSGKSHGEPWHVGMHGIGDTENVGIGSLLGKLFGSDLSYEDIGSIFPAFFTMLNPRGAKNGSSLKDEDIESRYSGDSGAKLLAAGNYKLGGTWGGTDIADSIRDAMAGAVSGAVTGGANSQTLAAAVQSLGKSSTGLSDGALVAILANAAGFSGQDLITAVAIAGRESSYNPKAHNPNRATGDDSYGLFQINMIDSLGPYRRNWFGISKNEDLWDPLINLKAAHQMAFSRDTPFYDWGPYKGKPATYDTDVNAAAGYVHEAGLGDVESYGGGGGGVSIGGSRMSFSNTFIIQGGGGGPNGGIDARRAASQIADQLEREMQGRMARNN